MILGIDKCCIRSRLFLAFGAIAGLTVAATVTASVLLAGLGDALRIVARDSVPRAIISLELAAKADGLAALAPIYLLPSRRTSGKSGGRSWMHYGKVWANGSMRCGSFRTGGNPWRQWPIWPPS